MGRIKKVATERHGATASPFVTSFVQRAIALPLHQLRILLSRFPQNWPFPRGDLYHWIPLLDRFDHVLELFNTEYGLDKGPQQQPFQCRLLQKGDAVRNPFYPAVSVALATLHVDGYSDEGDRELVEAILHFTRLLLEHCGNRSLYSSSARLNDLLHTCSLSLLQHCLKLGLRLAQRYEVARYKNNHPHSQATLLANHYDINMDRLHKLASPFSKPRQTATLAATPAKGKDKVSSALFNPCDLVKIAKDSDFEVPKSDLIEVNITYYDQPSTPSRSDAVGDTAPVSPTPARRSSLLGPSRERQSGDDRATANADASASLSKSREIDDTASAAPKNLHASAMKVESSASWEVLRELLPQVPEQCAYDVLNKVRISKAFAENAIQIALEIRLLAICNLAYALPESKFHEKIGGPDSEEPKRFHLAQQLCDLLQPPNQGQSALSMDLETAVLFTLEALSKSRHKTQEVTDALQVTHNHGVLYFQLRKAITTLHENEKADKMLERVEIEWREATFDLTNALLQSHFQPRQGERMVSAGLMTILIEALNLRTDRAERLHERILQFLDSFIHGITTAFQTLSAIKGLDIVADLTSYEVSTAESNTRNGRGMPAEYKSRVVDYDIPFYQQSTLRQLFKFIVHMFEHSGGTHDRLLRNLIDTPQILGALRTVIQNAHVYGSNVWSGAVNTVSSFIHNEPTSFQVVGEAGLVQSLLQTIISGPLEDVETASPLEDLRISLEYRHGQLVFPTPSGILPANDTMCDIPAAFGAICLNESGMKIFQTSKALFKFLDIFVSPPHVRALDDDSHVATAIGQSFDELSRHHPALKDQIMFCVVAMVRRVRDVCQWFAQEGTGAKLWQYTVSGPIVSGGKAALLGNPAWYNNEVAESAAGPATVSDIGETEGDRVGGVPYITACFRFLEGFFHNTSVCASFCEQGGAEYLLDLVTSASNPYDLVAFPVFSKIVQVFKTMCDVKPHLVLPSIIKRTQLALSDLKTFIAADDINGMFASFVSPFAYFAPSPDCTRVVKSIAMTHILTHILGRAFAPPSFTGRNTVVNLLFATLNFTDVYLELVDAMTQLHSALAWENLALQRIMPDLWKSATDPKPFVMRRVDSHGFAELTSEGKLSDPDHSHAHFPLQIWDDKQPHDGCAAKNVKTLRYLLSQTPMGIEAFFHMFCQALAAKRSSESSIKQHASVVADRLSKGLIMELKAKKYDSADDAMTTKYQAQVTASTARLLVKHASTLESTYPHKEALSLVLKKFYLHGGFDELNRCLKHFSETVAAQKRDTPNEQPDPVAREGLGTILGFYNQVVRSKCIVDAVQSSVIAVKDHKQSDFFMAAQFLVEVREIVLPAVESFWRSDNLDLMSENHVKMVIEILRTVVQGEGEDGHGVLRRADKATRRVPARKPEFKFKNSQGLASFISNGHDEKLAKEALYRCNNHDAHSREYINLRKVCPTAPEFAVPEPGPIVESNPSRASTDPAPVSEERRHSVEMNDASSSIPADAPIDGHALSDDNHDHEPTVEGEQQGDAGEASASQASAQPSNEPAKTELSTDALAAFHKDTHKPYVVLEDLETKRQGFLTNMIDRSLEVLSVHPHITFELADLIVAAVQNDSSSSVRSEIGGTLVSSLFSLQGEEASKEAGPKVAAYAHLVALIMQDREFFNDTINELKDNLDSIVRWIQVGSDQKLEDAPWVEMILLIVERILGEDEQPPVISWEPPPAESPLTPMPEPKLPDLIISDDVRLRLFDTLVDLLPKVGKKNSLALSVTRTLVILTRRRELALRLSDKQSMQRLFLMFRQLPANFSEKLRAMFMIILRHMVEDGEILRQIMEKEIKLAFESYRSSRPMDTTTYTRTLYHLVLRDPKLFVSVTQDLLEIVRYDSHPHRAQNLALKKKEQPEHESEDEHASLLAKSSEENGDEPQKTLEAKPPIVETTDGVINFLLRELSNYRDVEDKPATVKIDGPSDGSADVEMSNGSVTGGNTGSAENANSETSSLKSEEHTIYRYRCFLMQCVSELLSSYSRTKIEFINFSRKPETTPATPSKPRVGTLNYLLNVLLPVGTLDHRDEIGHLKRLNASYCASSVLVALCMKAQERPSDRMRRRYESDQGDADLTFIRKFVLEHAFRAFKEASTSSEPLDARYSRLLVLSVLFQQMLTKHSSRTAVGEEDGHVSEPIAKIMLEKNFVPALTSAIAEIDLNFPHAKRAVKYILAPLRLLTQLGVVLSQSAEFSNNVNGVPNVEDVSSASSVSDEAEEREQTPDLFRNSTLGIYENNGEDYESESASEEDDVGYDDEMDYEEELGHEHGDVISDDDEEDMEGLEDEIGDVEGLPGDVGMVEVIMEDPNRNDMPSDMDSLDDDEDVDEDEDDDDDDDDGDDVDEYDDQMDEISGDDENASLGGPLNEDEWEEDDGAEYNGDDGAIDDAQLTGPLATLANVIGGDAQVVEHGGLVRIDIGHGEEEFFEDEMPPEEAEGEDEEDAEYENNFVYEPDLEEDEEDDQEMNFEWGAPPPPPAIRGTHHHRHHLPEMFGLVGGESFRPFGGSAMRSHRNASNMRNEDDGTNPLLQRDGSSNGHSGDRENGNEVRSSRLSRRPAIPREIQDLVHTLGHGGHGTINVNFNPQMFNDFAGPIFAMSNRPVGLVDVGAGRFGSETSITRWPNILGHSGHDGRLASGHEHSTSGFHLVLTFARWQEEARMLFGGKHHEKATQVVPSILRLLVPPAMEAKRLHDEAEAKRKAAEEKAREEERQKAEAERLEREAQAKKEKEEREARESEERRAREQAQSESAASAAEDQSEEVSTADAEMESAQDPQTTGATAEGGEPEQSVQRITATVRGREFDITSLGIDLEYLDALPEDMREDVIMGQLAQRRAQPIPAGEQPTEIDRDFLDALPPELQQEILRQEARDRRHREAEEAQHLAAEQGNAPAPQPIELNNADFMAMLEPNLRQAILMDADENTLAALPENLQAEARDLFDDQRIARPGGHAGQAANNARPPHRERGVEAAAEVNRQRRPTAQMLDKAGVATLMRLMFVSLHYKAKGDLQSVLSDVCKNTQGRAEVISMLLNILQDGTADVSAVERSFAQLSLRAKQSNAPRAPQPLKRTIAGTTIASGAELSPLNIVQQCLHTLKALAGGNHRVASFFLSEHETASSQKNKTTKKGKGRESNASKFPLNALLVLLDRKIITENTGVMETLAALLARVTQPLNILLKRRKDFPALDEAADNAEGNSAEQAGATDVAMEEDSGAGASSSGQGEARVETSESKTGVEENANPEADKKPRKDPVPPEVPEENLRLVVNIISARECPGRTFNDTVDLIRNLSLIPGAREVFGKELVRQAQDLAQAVSAELEELALQIDGAATDTDLQGMALAKFAPASAKQNKVLRVLLALDYLFDPKRISTSEEPSGSAEPQLKVDILASLYRSPVFDALWANLSQCLAAIRKRGNMVNVAATLLPAIESLMVVCRNTTLPETLNDAVSPASPSAAPAVAARMEMLFFTFTEDNRKILNELIRNNPKLMNGNLSVMAKNSKVLEFDNKRSYFTRKLHNRGSDARHEHKTLQLNVHRDRVFHDSYKELYFKKGEEIKYGKLNVRFLGEEGVDAGGVGREWFAAMARQMFNPDYALFNPVASDRTTFHPNPLSEVNDEHLLTFKFIGRIIGKALYENRVLDCHFSRAVYRRILGKSVSLKDMESLDLDYYKSLVWILENDITDITFETFSVDVDRFGVTETHDLIENGRNIPVTQENKQEYVRLVVEHRLVKSVEEQLEQFLSGFHDIIPRDLVAIFNEQELELLISGLPDIDVDDWKNNTEYHNYQATSPQIQWFWRAVRSFDKEEKAKLLQFITGTSKVPLNGFKELEGMNGFAKFNIHRDYSSKEKLPSSHTCFNQLDLPEYDSYEHLRQQLYTAITAGSEYFGFA